MSAASSPEADASYWKAEYNSLQVSLTPALV
jgi:hypothetical protein